MPSNATLLGNVWDDQPRNRIQHGPIRDVIEPGMQQGSTTVMLTTRLAWLSWLLLGRCGLLSGLDSSGPCSVLTCSMQQQSTDCTS
jgi:hypothetical protein